MSGQSDDGTDQTTIATKDGVDASDAPLAPVDIEDLEIDGADVLGAVEVNSADKKGGVWNLTLAGNFAARGFDVVDVDERLTEGTYALVRMEDDS